jgi:hypothetical protein
LKGSLLILVPNVADPVVPTPGVLKEWLADGEILCYRMDNTERISIDQCTADFARSVTEMPPNHYLRLLIDLRSENAVISAYALHRAREVCRLRADIRGQIAVLVTNRLTSQIASLALRGLPLNSNRARLVFSCEAEAIAWLLGNGRIA